MIPTWYKKEGFAGLMKGLQTAGRWMGGAAKATPKAVPKPLPTMPKVQLQPRAPKPKPMPSVAFKPATPRPATRIAPARPSWSTQAWNAAKGVGQVGQKAMNVANAALTPLMLYQMAGGGYAEPQSESVETAEPNVSPSYQGQNTFLDSELAQMTPQERELWRTRFSGPDNFWEKGRYLRDQALNALPLKTSGFEGHSQSAARTVSSLWSPTSVKQALVPSLRRQGLPRVSGPTQKPHKWVDNVGDSLAFQMERPLRALNRLKPLRPGSFRMRALNFLTSRLRPEMRRDIRRAVFSRPGASIGVPTAVVGALAAPEIGLGYAISRAFADQQSLADLQTTPKQAGVPSYLKKK